MVVVLAASAHGRVKTKDKRRGGCLDLGFLICVTCGAADDV